MKITVLTLTRLFKDETGNYVKTPKIAINIEHEVKSVKDLIDLYCNEYKCDDVFLEMTKWASEKEFKELQDTMNLAPDQYKKLKEMGVDCPTYKDVTKLKVK